MKASLIVPVEQLRDDPYTWVLCYPKPDKTELEKRICELQSHGVTNVELSGGTNTYGIPAPILGKGYVGIVVVAYLNDQRVALKIRRVDADRQDLLHEAKMLAKANTIDVGPKFIGASKNFLFMQLIEGDLLPLWLVNHKEKPLVQKVLGEVLENCYRLDTLGLDHGELSKAPKHVLIDKQQRVFIVDFETASEVRKTANLLSICHFLFIGGGEVVKTVEERLGERNKSEIIKALQEYKKNRTRESFESVLQSCLY